MRRGFAAVAALGVLAGCGGGGGSSSTATNTAATPQKTQTTRVEVIRSSDGGGSGFDPQAIYKSEAPGVVTVIALSGGGEALGSGFVIDSAGYVATNAHVVTGQSGGKAKQVYVQFSDGNKLSASIVGTDLDSDVALLKVDPSELRGPGATLVPLPFGATSNVKVGDPVAAIGSPFGEPQSLSVGVVSALNRDIESLTNFPIGNAVQTDAAINHGNSGGPLLQRDGKVIGINSQIRSSGGGGEGVGFAIPVETVKHSVAQLRAKGHVDYAYLGVSSVPLYPQLAEHLGLKEATGALVDQVVPGGPADKAGLHGASSHTTFQGEPRIPVGSDLIAAVDGRKLTPTDDLTDLIGLHQPGDTVQLTIGHDGRQRTIAVKLGKRPERVTGAH
ncbi:MAG TPA: trypsin-like peptidase domain-containing protein [Thermoleophilaceae bacterium]|nr:trypsin-like peptidase domain-containing protein [Thermoleophilaceae bacterium]